LPAGPSRRGMAGDASVLVVEDYRPFARRVSQALGAGASVEHVMTLHDAQAALRARSFALLILDVRLPDGDGLRFAEELPRPRRPGLVILTGAATDDVRARADAIDAPCFEKGDLRAHHLAQILTHHLERARARERATEERKLAIAHRLGERYGLTKTEKRVLGLIALGHARNEIAEELEVGVNCVKKHLHAIFSKLERVIPDRSMKAIECWILDQALWEAVEER